MQLTHNMGLNHSLSRIILKAIVILMDQEGIVLEWAERLLLLSTDLQFQIFKKIKMGQPRPLFHLFSVF